MLSRRAWLACLATIFGGCMNRSDKNGRAQSEQVFSLTMTIVADAEISRREVLSLTEAVASNDQKLIREAITTGSVENTTISPVLEPEATLQVRYQESIYKIATTVLDKHGTGRYEYEMAIDDVDEDVSRSNITSFDALPEVDQSHLAEQGFDEVTNESNLGYAFHLTYTPSEQNQSELVPEPANSVIEWKSNVRGQIRLVNTRQKYRRTYRYTAKELGSLEEVGENLRRKYSFSLSDLSDEQQEIVSEAIKSENGYRITGGDDVTVPDSVHDLFQQFSDQVDKALNYDDKSKKLTSRAYYLINYDGETYWTELHYRSDVFDADRKQG